MVTETPGYVIASPFDGAKIARKYIGDEDREVFLVMCLNTQNHVVAVHRAHTGSLNSSIVSPREVFMAAILNNAASVIFAHNHPSYITKPSREDLKVTHRLKQCGEFLGIEVLDHLIVSDTEDFYSMRENDDM